LHARIVFTGPLLNNALAIHITIFYKILSFTHHVLRHGKKYFPLSDFFIRDNTETSLAVWSQKNGSQNQYKLRTDTMNLLE
jgi:hypothetical protein